jgi:hypothetical protein
MTLVVGSVPDALVDAWGAISVGTTAADAVDGADLPATLAAVTVTVYETPGVNPPTFAEFVDPPTVTGATAGVVCTTNEVGAPAVAGSRHVTLASDTPAEAVTSIGASGNIWTVKGPAVAGGDAPFEATTE